MVAVPTVPNGIERTPVRSVVIGVVTGLGADTGFTVGPGEQGGAAVRVTADGGPVYISDAPLSVFS